MSNEFIDNFLKFARPGYNGPEQRWHFNRFQSQQSKIAALGDLAKEVSEGQKISIPEATRLILDAERQDADAMSQLGQWLEQLGKISDDIALEKNTSERDLATMMLASRLPLEWVVENKAQLEIEYCVELPPDASMLEPGQPVGNAVNYARLLKLKRPKWLDNKELWAVMQSITDMLPGSVVSEISAYAINEFRDGKQPELAPAELPEETVGKPVPALPVQGEPVPV